MQLQLTEPCNIHPLREVRPLAWHEATKLRHHPICSLPKMYCKLFITIIKIPTLTEYWYDML